MEFLDYFSNVFTVYHIALLVGGTFAGIILGALPGLSPTMSVALLIPFTFHMKPESGLILLGAMYTATVAGGAISAILVNVPGAPANIATAMDGHQMAKKGLSREALHYCFMSSFVGGIFGVFILIFFTPPLARLSLEFGTTELFWIAILGITIIATIDSKSVVKGLLSGLFGLMLATIGDNPVLGVERFVFTDHLEGGVNIVVGLIGLFAMPQVLHLMEKYYSEKNAVLSSKGESSLMQSFRFVFGKVKALSIGSFVGSLIGIIPGAGGTFRLPRVIGVQNAKYWIYSAKKFKGEEAKKFGFLLDCVEKNKLFDTGLLIANDILKNAPIAVKSSKKAIKNSLFEINRINTLKNERNSYNITLNTKDRDEALDAFLNKRKPNWNNE